MKRRISGGPVDRLRRLAMVMRPTERDTVELSFSSSGSDGALILPDAPRSDDTVLEALRCSAIDQEGLAVLLELVRDLPGGHRRGIRLVSDGGVSLYWEGRMATEEQVRVARLAGQYELAAMAEKLSIRGNGVAYQQSPSGAARMRLYAVFASKEILGKLFDQVADEVGLPRETEPGLVRLWQDLEPRFPVIANFSCTGREGATALKLEFPCVELRRLRSLGRLSGPERSALQRASHWLEKGTEALNFLGVRVFGDGRRELTFYVEAAHLLPDASGRRD